MRNFTHLFSNYIRIRIYQYQQHLIIIHCLKIISTGTLPPSDFSAFRNLCTKLCSGKTSVLQSDDYQYVLLLLKYRHSTFYKYALKPWLQ